MAIFVDFPALEDCKKPEWSYGEICVQCNTHGSNYNLS